MEWLTNGIPPWEAYRSFMLGRLIALDKHPGVPPVEVEEMWPRLFSKILLKVTGPEATMAFQDDNIFAVIKAGIEGVIHRVQDL